MKNKFERRNTLEQNEQGYSLEDIVAKSPYAHLNTAKAADAVLNDFNQGRETIMTSGFNALFTHRLVKQDEFLLVQKNGVPELVGPSNIPVRRQKIFNFRDSSSTLAQVKQSQVLIGANGHFVINVPPGKYAKVYDGNKALLLDQGQHVIHSNNFRFDPSKDLVDQKSLYIAHNDINILRVPQGQVAIVRVENKSMFLESRPEPYVFKTQQFILESPDANNLFHQANSKKLQAGTQIRLIPDVGDIAVVNNYGHFDVIKPSNDKKEPMIIDIANARFDGFLTTNLQNVEFPSDQHKIEGRENINYDYYYTADGVEVGVRFFVCYRIVNPDKTLQNLSLSGIRNHIESVVTTDMGNAIKQTSTQDLLATDLTTIKNKEKQKEGVLQHWQDKVKTKLCHNLDEYGIELVRLNIEEAKIQNAEIEKQMSSLAITSARTRADLSALDATLKTRELSAQQDRDLAIKRQENDVQLNIMRAEGGLKAASIKAEEEKVLGAAAAAKQAYMVKIAENSPEAMMMNFLQAFVQAIQGGHFSSALPLSDLSNLLTTFINQITQATGKNPPSIKDSANQTFFGNGEKPVEPTKPMQEAPPADLLLSS